MNAPNRFELFIVPDNEEKWVLNFILMYSIELII